MAKTTYGAGTALQFTDASQRQVLELGSKIHYYNPSVTPLLTLMGRMSTSVTPVPIFEWMEDEYMMQKSIKQACPTIGTDTTTAVTTSAYETTDGVNGTGVIINFDKQAALEVFEVGGVYLCTESETSEGGSAIASNVTHVLCVAIGQNVDSATALDRSVQFVGLHTGTGTTDVTGDDVWYHEPVADGTALFAIDASNDDTFYQFDYVGTAGVFYDNGVKTKYTGASISPSGGDSGFGVHNLAAADYFKKEGGIAGHAEGAAVGVATNKKVRRLKNCTQIFREPYSITGTAQASKHYGGSELARLQARKLAKIKSDIEFAMLTNGDIGLDASSENPKRTMAGFGLGQSAGTGFIKSLDGRGDSNLQLAFASAGLDDMDAAVEYIFSDLVEGSMEKTVLCSNKWLRFITALGRKGIGPTGSPAAGTNGLVMNQEAGAANVTAGLSVTSYNGPVGKLNFVSHPLLRGAYENFALAVDMANVDLRPLASRDMQLRSDIVNDGRDGRTDEWLMEVGCEVRNEQTHAILKLT
jgi:hypothetical protein